MSDTNPNELTRPLSPKEADAARQQFDAAMRKIVKAKPKPADKKK